MNRRECVTYSIISLGGIGGRGISAASAGSLSRGLSDGGLDRVSRLGPSSVGLNSSDNLGAIGGEGGESGLVTDGGNNLSSVGGVGGELGRLRISLSDDGLDNLGAIGGEGGESGLVTDGGNNLSSVGGVGGELGRLRISLSDDGLDNLGAVGGKSSESGLIIIGTSSGDRTGGSESLAITVRQNTGVGRNVIVSTTKNSSRNSLGDDGAARGVGAEDSGDSSDIVIISVGRAAGRAAGAGTGTGGNGNTSLYGMSVSGAPVWFQEITTYVGRWRVRKTRPQQPAHRYRRRRSSHEDRR